MYPALRIVKTLGYWGEKSMHTCQTGILDSELCEGRKSSRHQRRCIKVFALANANLNPLNPIAYHRRNNIVSRIADRILQEMEKYVEKSRTV